MIRGLTKVSWGRVDVSFSGSKQRYFAHSTIQVGFFLVLKVILQNLSFFLCYQIMNQLIPPLWCHLFSFFIIIFTLQAECQWAVAQMVLSSSIRKGKNWPIVCITYQSKWKSSKYDFGHWTMCRIPIFIELSIGWIWFRHDRGNYLNF